MKNFRYISGESTLRYDQGACVGCKSCTKVCPHGVFVMEGSRADVADAGGCMECGACALNCPGAAISVEPGVGCAAYIVQAWLSRVGSLLARLGFGRKPGAGGRA